jgi:hypothetical protein
MDQDSAPGGKSSWRDRLGIPKDEAENNVAEAARRPVPEATRLAPRAPLPSSAPVAPGASRPPVAPSLAPRASLQPSRPAPLSARSDAAATDAPSRSASSEGLAERLRVQREAAERMAEQRLALARQRAAARVQEAQVPAAPRIAAPTATAPVTAKTPTAAPAAPASAAPAAPVQPRFSFADEINRSKRAPLAPARPASLPPLRPSTAPLAPPAPASRAEPRLEGPRGSAAPFAPRPPLRPRIDESRPGQSFSRDMSDDFEDGFLEPAGNGYTEPRPQPGRAPLALASVQRDEPSGSEDEMYFTAQQAAALEKEPAPRKGPLLLLGSLLGVIVLFAIGIFVWQQMPSGTATVPVETEVPVVSAPAEPIKMEPSAETIGDETAADEAAGKKQIYDRILGDEEQGGLPENIVPSEETPVPQGAAPDSFATSPDEPSAAETPAAEPPAAEPPSDDLLPIPAEPEVPGPNGALDLQEPDAMAAALPVPAEAQMAEPAPAAPATPAAPAAVAALEAPADVPAVEIPGIDAPAPAAPGPVSLVVTPRPKPKQFAEKPVAPALPPTAPATEQVASVDAAAPVVTPTAYVAQLSSLNSEADAKAEFGRVRSAHSAIVGSLTPVITKADLGTRGTIFRLGLGPLLSKESASKLCAQLIAAGEKDCIVRRQ